jgi:hypothetical protein
MTYPIARSLLHIRSNFSVHYILVEKGANGRSWHTLRAWPSRREGPELPGIAAGNHDRRDRTTAYLIQQRTRREASLMRNSDPQLPLRHPTLRSLSATRAVSSADSNYRPHSGIKRLFAQAGFSDVHCPRGRVSCTFALAPHY